MQRSENFKTLIAILFAITLTLPVQVAAWHFEVVSVGGEVIAITYPGCTIVTNPFQLGSVTSEIGNAYAHSDLELGDDDCTFVASAQGHAPSMGSGGEGFVQHGFVLRVVADDGDSENAFIDIVWISESVGDDSPGDLCNAHGLVGAALSIENETDPLVVIDMSVNSMGTAQASGTQHIGPIREEALARYYTFKVQEDMPPGIYGGAASVEFMCGLTGRGYNGFSMVLSDAGIIATESMTWGAIKKLLK